MNLRIVMQKIPYLRKCFYGADRFFGRFCFLLGERIRNPDERIKIEWIEGCLSESNVFGEKINGSERDSKEDMHGPPWIYLNDPLNHEWEILWKNNLISLPVFCVHRNYGNILQFLQTMLPLFLFSIPLLNPQGRDLALSSTHFVLASRQTDRKPEAKK